MSTKIWDGTITSGVTIVQYGNVINTDIWDWLALDSAYLELFDTRTDYSRPHPDDPEYRLRTGYFCWGASNNTDDGEVMHWQEPRWLSFPLNVVQLDPNAWWGNGARIWLADGVTCHLRIYQVS